jgi:hypothetical protein
MTAMLWRFLNSPANWCGLAIAIAVVGARAMDLLGAYWWASVIVGYLAGFWLGKSLFGTPQLVVTDLDALDAALVHREKPEAMEEALEAVRTIAKSNIGKYFSPEQATALTTLTKAIEDLHAEWMRSERNMSMENAFVAKRLAIEYLPDTVRRFLAIPPRFAATKMIAHNKTATQLFDESVSEMQKKVSQLQDDLAAQDAEAFANHAEFLNQKFGPSGSVTNMLNQEKAHV